MRLGPIGRVVVFVAVVGLLAGCSRDHESTSESPVSPVVTSSGPSDAPLTEEGGMSGLGLRRLGRSRFTFPIGRARLSDDVGPVTLLRAHLASSDGLNLIEVRVQRIPDGKSPDSLIGVTGSYPPKEWSNAFRATEPLEGLVIDRSDAEYAFYAGIRNVNGGTAGPIVIEYADKAGRRYQLRGKTYIEVCNPECRREGGLK